MKILITFISSLALVCLLSGGPSDFSIDTVLSDPVLKPYHGWVRYLDYRYQNAVEVSGAESDAAKEWGGKLQDWLQRIEENPNTIQEMEGVFEWAYESQADLSGQPFKMAVPLNYDPNKQYGISLYIHGYSGNHMEHATGMVSEEGYFNLSVLGRARGGMYQNLSEADVLDVLKYVQENWNIDPQRIHFNGGSMGGWATFYLSNRYPHLVASARPTCGFAADLPIGNWMHIPFYSIHSKDDPVVPIVMSRVPLHALAQAGGKVILDETNGYGHASWDYAEGGARAGAWYPNHRAPIFDEVYDIDYTALDGKARRGYWANLIEWGYDQAPARFQLSATCSNELYVTLTNVGILEVEIGKGPFDLSQELMLAINGQIPQHLPAPLPEVIYLVQTDEGVIAQAEQPELPNYHLRYPGSARNLYSGEPLLIVWGTQGAEEENAAIARAALAARRSQHPVWALETGQEGPDGVIHEHNTYGLLAGKPDTEVTDEDIQSHHLVLIGSARQNSVVARVVKELPLAIEMGTVAASDGTSWAIENPATLVTYYNPLASDHLIYWVACESADFYTPDNPVVNEAHNSAFGASQATDVILYDWDKKQMVAARDFDPLWQWKPEDQVSPLIPEEYTSYAGLADFETRIITEATGADFAIVGRSKNEGQQYALGQSCMVDISNRYYREEIALMDMPGSEVLRFKAVCDSAQDKSFKYCLSGSVPCEDIHPEAIYRVGMDLVVYWELMSDLKTVPDNLRYSGVSVREAFRIWLEKNL